MTVLRNTALTGQDDDQRFRVKNSSFSFHRQYTQIYTARLASLKPLLVLGSAKKWNSTTDESNGSDQPPIRSLADLEADQRCVIIGTTYKVSDCKYMRYLFMWSTRIKVYLLI
ncbi:unnamed protein product [Echinostoma caproni]|uniref:DNA_pol_D_N domain-containing protein n=1 Tax=Echinostoma caproni TaxID=27848 RepID=A0A183A0U3_9TREM|nr:unnamed protein product [Echinostoma caproni]